MQKLYDLVVLIHPQTSKDEQATIYAKIDSLLGNGKKETDDMGLTDLAHPIGKAKLSQVHMVSYYCELDSKSIVGIKQELTLTKGVVRFAFYSMGAHEPFHTFATINKKFEKPQVAEGEKKPEPLVKK
jgi:ribosomal protein S6